MDKIRPEVCSDVISDVCCRPTGVKVHVNLGDSRSNRSHDIRLRHFVTNDDDDNNDNDAGGGANGNRAKRRLLRRRRSFA